MTSPSAPPSPTPPSLATLAKTTAIAVVGAGVILVATVLPAEYGVDPLGIGRRLGLLDISAPPLNPIVEPPPGTGAVLVPTVTGPVGTYASEYQFDVATIDIGPYEYVEYKYHLEKEATMLYAWAADRPVMHDMHGEPDEAGAEETSYDKQSRRHSNGAFVAPFAGIHGWYWENPSAEPVTVTLSTAGFYTSATEMRSDRTRLSHPLRTLGTLAAVPALAPPTGPR